MQDNVIAIDGPAGSGKSTVAKAVAKKLGFLYVDTGAMYRALTLKAIESGADFSDEKQLINISQNADIKLADHNGELHTFLDGKDVSHQIRTLKVGEKIKYVARIKGVRSNMVKLQRQFARAEKGAVLEGRDIGTVVFPNAKYKFYLDASVEERINRRHKELKSKGMEAEISTVGNDVKSRDESDRTRDVAPLMKAKNAVYIDTTSMSIEEVISAVLGHIK